MDGRGWIWKGETVGCGDAEVLVRTIRELEGKVESVRACVSEVWDLVLGRE